MNVDLLNVKAGENTSTSQCDFRQTAANSSAVIGSQDCNRRVHFAATEVYLAGCDASDCSREDEILDSAEDAQSRPQIWYTVSCIATGSL